MPDQADRSTLVSPPGNGGTPLARQQEPPWWAFKGVLLVSVLLLLTYSVAVGHRGIFPVALLVVVAALSVGAALGFLFGIPRSRASGAGNGSDGFEPSNSLEQVSDWLTKALVGVGLVQFEEARGLLSSLGAAVAIGVGGAATSAVSQLSIVIGLLTGFLASYLWTRVYYSAIQVQAEQGIRALLKGAEALNAQTKVLKEESQVLKEQSAQNLSAAGKLLQSNANVPASPAVTIAPSEVEVEAKIEQFRQEPALWDSDPVEKYFSGLPSAANGLRLSGRVDTQTSDALILTLRVEGTDGKTLEGNVTFLLHPTLPNPVQVVTTRNNAAQTTIYTEGWFHAAAVAEAGRTVLVLDLRTIPGVPEWYTKA